MKHLDGTLGQRHFSAVFSRFPPSINVERLSIGVGPIGRARPIRITSLIQVSASVTVVPAPSAVLVCAGAVLAASMRRRSRMI